MNREKYKIEFDDYHGTYSIVDSSINRSSLFVENVMSSIKDKNYACHITTALNKAYLDGYMDCFLDDEVRELSEDELKELTDEELQELTNEWQEHLKKARGE
jgi:hypothetical protein